MDHIHRVTISCNSKLLEKVRWQVGLISRIETNGGYQWGLVDGNSLWSYESPIWIDSIISWILGDQTLLITQPADVDRSSSLSKLCRVKIKKYSIYDDTNSFRNLLSVPSLELQGQGRRFLSWATDWCYIITLFGKWINNRGPGNLGMVLQTRSSQNNDLYGVL